MNSKSITIITIIILIVSIFFWQFTQKNSNMQSLLQDNVSKIFNTNNKGKQVKSTENLVEVFYLPHPPIAPIREKIADVIQKHPNYKLKEYSFDDPDNQDKIQDYNLTGHIPVAIFINGQNEFTINGRKINFTNFPKGDAFVPTLEGSWNYDDLQQILTNTDQYQK